MKITAAVFVLVFGVLVVTCARSREVALPKHWRLIDQTLDVKSGAVVAEKRADQVDYLQVTDCLKAMVGRISRPKNGTVHQFVCRHNDREIST